MTMFDLSARMKNIQPSVTFGLNAKANELRSQGIDVINLAIGEPDFDTPEWIQDAAINAIKGGITRYTPSDGFPDLKKAIQTKMTRDYKLDYDLDMITAGAGSKQILFNALLASINPGDEVIIPAPYWGSYPEIVRFCEGVPVIVPCSPQNDFKITANQLDGYITDRTRWIILNSPNNPTGAYYSGENLKKLSSVLMEYNKVNILTDDIYENLIYDDEKFINILQVEPRLKFRTLIINGVSKSYAMTGWRLGFGVGPKNLIQGIKLLSSQSTSNACSISQAAAIAALTGPQDFLEDWKKSYQERRDASFELINSIPHLSCIMPKGAFFHYVNCAKLIYSKTQNGNYLKTEDDIVSYLLTKAKVMVVGGASFGLSPFFRISYASSMDNVKTGCKRISKAISNLIVN